MIGTYNNWVVLLSFLVAILASYTALDLASRITASTGAAAASWLLGGAFAMGMGIWSMHFIGMLAFSLPIPAGTEPMSIEELRRTGPLAGSSANGK